MSADGSTLAYIRREGADWLLLGSEVEFHHADYDLAAAAARVRASGYSHAEFAATMLLSPPAADEMTALYERAALS